MKNYVWSLFVLPLILGLEGHARTPSRGDGFLCLGDSGYAYLEDASVADFDYSKDLSVEIVARIEPHQEGGRWATFIEKGGDLVLSQALSPGFGIGTSEGNAAVFGQHLQAKIGDGANHLSLWSPKAYQGYVHAVMTWNTGAQTLTLFVNGQLIASRSNSAISARLIKNKADLRIGKGRYTLRRNVFLARLWNRMLSASEVTAVWNRFADCKSHDLPAGLDRSGLLSEWAMDRTQNAPGNSDADLLRDRVGKNHLKLAAGARLVVGEGALKAVSPTNGATGVDKSVLLTASGGGSELGGSFTSPLHYLFQIDELATFNSSALRQSGWMAHYAEWKPILKPGTQYFWRVKVRDSATPPRESAFSDVYALRTRGPSTWYVRPLVDLDDAKDDLGNPIPDPDVYGKQDGTSYANAFNGIAHVKWGAGGVEAGDTLYLCDTHVYHSSHGYWAPPTVGYIRESGFSSEYPIVVAMDHPEHPGTLCGFFQNLQTAVKWVGPDQNGVYRTQDLPYGAAVEARDGLYLWLERATATTWKGHWGAAYNVPRTGEPWLVGTSYVKMSDGSSPEGRVYSPEVGFRFDLGRSSYVKFAGGRFFNSLLMTDSNDNTESEFPPAHHVVLEGCDLGYWSESMVEVQEGDDWIIRGCNIHHAGRGVHAVAAQRLLVERCNIHDIGAPDFPHNDAHAIGVRNGANHTIQKNHVWNAAGSAIEFWSGRSGMRNMIVRYNFIHDTTGLAATSASGIVISGENSPPGSRTGFRIHNNIIMNTAGGDEFWRGWGISSNNMDPVEIYNNVLYRTYHGIRLVTSTPSPGYPVKAKVHNNMIIEPKDRYAFVDGSAQPWDELLWDYNLYYPAIDMVSGFSFGQSVARDGHSILGDPRFLAGQPQDPADFRLRSDSPAIDLGIDVGLTVDYAGRTIPQGSAPDIGAFEYGQYP